MVIVKLSRLVDITNVEVIDDHELRLSFEGGTIVWPEDGLDMAPESLYQDARRRLVTSRV